MTASLEVPITTWYAGNARDLPWRRPDVGAWPIFVSEFMLQQTPVSRVLPAYDAWIARWPTAAALAGATPADAVRQWDRLGYPRRAVRLHACATILTNQHAGEVPTSISQLRALPGVGSYTAAAVASFAFGQRHAVLDTNVRRVLARLVAGQDLGPRSLSAAETALAQSLLPPAGDNRAARWSVALMELGALVCTSARPACDRCPVAAMCSWRLRGSPRSDRKPRSQPYAGTDRQCRGALLAALRAASGPVQVTALDGSWPQAAQRTRNIDGLIADGLAVWCGEGLVGLPGEGGQANLGQVVDSAESSGRRRA